MESGFAESTFDTRPKLIASDEFVRKPLAEKKQSDEGLRFSGAILVN